MTVNGIVHRGPRLVNRITDYDAEAVENEEQDTAPTAARRVTLRDVARVAGVSHQTVSRAINDKGEIDPETRRRVLDAARQLRYRPSRFGRGLVRPATTTVGLVVANVVNPFYPEIIAGVIDAAESRGWKTLISTTQYNADREPALLRSLSDQVDALICYLYQPDDVVAAAIEGVPLVLMSRRPQDPAFAAVDIDIRTGMQAAVSHLLARGHRHIGMIDCPDARDPARKEQFLAVAAEHGIPVAADAVASVHQSVAGGEEGLEQLRRDRPDLTAVLSFNDLVAMGAHRAARRQGLAIPGDLALVGFDGLTMGEFLEPPLTTIDIDKRQMGELAVAQVEHLLAGTVPPPALVRPELLIRAST
ncbi:LacI family transcriptional regulator [Actinoplanes sp. NBRC 101535]|nr:LacI family transcriptional regulator [Actinoplanes sp. NBRC 101535]